MPLYFQDLDSIYITTFTLQNHIFMVELEKRFLISTVSLKLVLLLKKDKSYSEHQKALLKKEELNRMKNLKMPSKESDKILFYLINNQLIFYFGATKSLTFYFWNSFAKSLKLWYSLKLTTFSKLCFTSPKHKLNSIIVTKNFFLI